MNANLNLLPPEQLDLRFDVSQTGAGTFLLTPTEQPFQGGWTKPREFLQFDQLMACLATFGIDRLPEIGAKVVWKSNIPVQDLGSAGLLKIRENVSPELLLFETFETSSVSSKIQELGFSPQSKKLTFLRKASKEVNHSISFALRKSRLPESAIGAVRIDIEIVSPVIRTQISKQLGHSYRAALCTYMAPSPLRTEFFDRESALHACDRIKSWLVDEINPLISRIDSVESFVRLSDNNSDFRIDTISLVAACLFLGLRDKAREHSRWLPLGSDSVRIRNAVFEA